MPQVEGEAADLSEQCAECEKKGGDGEGFAADGQQISTQEDEQHKCQCEEGNRQQIDFSAVHGVRSETVCSDYSRLGRYSLELGKMPSETAFRRQGERYACLFQRSMDSLMTFFASSASPHDSTLVVPAFFRSL